MPAYLFECEICKKQKELIFSMKNCPEFVKCSKKNCKGTMTKIITGGAGFILKGGGWPGKDGSEKQERKNKSDSLAKKMDEKRNAGEGVKNMKDLKK